jgi:hypothetical protein
MFNTIVVGVGGPAGGRDALSLTARLARPAGVAGLEPVEVVACAPRVGRDPPRCHGQHGRHAVASGALPAARPAAGATWTESAGPERHTELTGAGDPS